MNEMEKIARENHRNGNNCSASLAMAFAEKLGVTPEGGLFQMSDKQPPRDNP
jgi:hypothetical protein